MEIGDNDEQHVRQRLTVNRPAYNEEQFKQVYQETGKQDASIIQVMKKRLSKCSCTRRDVNKMVTGFFPVLKWLPEYNVKEALVGDIMSGFTVGILRLPQGMAYGILATLAPVYGLYTVFFPALIYSLMGTCMHLSIGSFAVVSIMTGTAVEKGIKFAKEELAANDQTEFDEDYERARIASTVAFLVGIIQIGLAILRLGFISTYLALPLVRGFTTGAACYVFNSQFKSLFGLTTQRYEGSFVIVKSMYEVFSNLHRTNPAELTLAVSCIVVLITVKELQDRFLKKITKYPVPIELFVIVIGTAVSYAGKLEERFDVTTVGDIPTGLPMPIVPPMKYVSIVFSDALTISIVTFSVAVSMGFIFGKRNNYEIDPNQELYAIGASNVFCSVFMCYPAASSLSRSILQETAGGTTQIAGTLSCMFILLVLLFMGPLFEPLPKSVLAAIVVVALRGMFRQFKDVKEYWKSSKVDCFIWLVTFLSVVLLGVDIGLIVGVAFAIYTVIFRTQHPQYSIMGRIPDTDIYRDIQYSHKAEEVPQVKIFGAQSPIYYANAEHIKDTLYSKVSVNPLKVQMKRAKARRKQKAQYKKKDKKWQRKSLYDGSYFDEHSNRHYLQLNSTTGPTKEEAANVLSDSPALSRKNNISDNQHQQNDDNQQHNDGKHHHLVEVDHTNESSAHNDTSEDQLDSGFCSNWSSNNRHSHDNNHSSSTPRRVSITHPNGRTLSLTNGGATIYTEQTPGDNLVNIHTIILDLSCVSFVDIVGANTIKSIVTNYQKIGVNVLLAQCRGNIQHFLHENGCITEVGLDRMFLTLHDAVLYAENPGQNASQPSEPPACDNDPAAIEMTIRTTRSSSNESTSDESTSSV